MVDELTVVDRIPLNRVGWTRGASVFFFYIDRSANEDRGSSWRRREFSLTVTEFWIEGKSLNHSC